MKRVLQVGAGGFGEKWCGSFLPRAARRGLLEVVGLVDIDIEALERSRLPLGLPASACFTDIETAFTSVKADFCTIVVPPAYHLAVVDQAVRREMHILSEKPIADSLSTAAEIVSKVSRAGLKMAVTMSHRFDQDKQTLTEIVRSGHLGKLNTVHCRLSADHRLRDSWRRFRHEMKHALLIEGAPHHLDIVDSLAGGGCRSVYARTWRPEWAEYVGDTDGIVLLEFDNGVHATYEASQTSPIGVSSWSHEQIRIEGADGIAILDDRKVEVFQRVYGLKPRMDAGFQVGQRSYHGGGMKVPLLMGDVWTHDLLIEQFVHWLDGGPAPETNAPDNFRSLAIAFAAIESVETNALVNFSEFLSRFSIS